MSATEPVDPRRLAKDVDTLRAWGGDAKTRREGVTATTLRAAAHALYDEFRLGDGLHPYIQSIGEAENAGEIRIFLVRKPHSHERPIPATWMGYPVATRVSGRLRMG